ncbi:uncharacterized protein BO96DRAFT_178286 [Aspergillus niger CBS 101883]|uniref:Contig An02c0360, genomic contig n=4 Tax=Aspergillus TaxID=5052 RepID=A2QEL4_ASPNC|nr:uncharacterized protein BO96DRAFT_178286 [Aspergillus niger CBS 101883]XP_059603511.1 uncharacterized protein An02g11490 [Aspergillus niger]PYH59904.1 hypothetical protein BO96DRAFT_178286 [Aspergillus niger CBS 101883]RDH23156.1 hypothetical protein M747DRAFT_163859 [Aspergillus niger ATCC 13496]CAK44475.1 unnamed protein product [Aspergillus niger]
MAKPVYNYPSSPGSIMSIKRNKRTRANPYVHTMHAGSAVIHPVIQPGGELVRKKVKTVIDHHQAQRTTPSECSQHITYQGIKKWKPRGKASR